MQEIADAGGLIGVGFWDGAACDATPAGVARQIAATAHLKRAFPNLVVPLDVIGFPFLLFFPVDRRDLFNPQF